MNRRIERRDAIIVGGGPAGSTLAWKMVAAGWDPLVLDRARFPREKLCAGWITPPVLHCLEIDPAEYREVGTIQEFQGFAVSRLCGGEVRTDYGRAVSYGIVRREFDHFLLRRSRAEYRDGVRVDRLEPVDGGWLVNGLFWTPLLIGAGGHFCPVARSLGSDLKKEKKLSTLELERLLEQEELEKWRVSGTVPEIVYFDDIRGYGWIFRKGNFVNVGIGRTRNRHLRRHLDQFLEEMEKRGRIPAARSLPAESFRGHPYKLHFVTPRQIVGDGVLLVGDAAGVTFNYSGEGIRPAVESALLAWQTIFGLGGAYGRERLSGYRSALYERLGTPVTGWRFRLMEALPPAVFQTFGRIVLSVPLLARRIFLERLFLRRQEWNSPVVSGIPGRPPGRR